MGRGDIIKETTLEVFNTKDKEYWNAIPMVSKNHMEEDVTSEGVDYVARILTVHWASL